MTAGTFVLYRIDRFPRGRLRLQTEKRRPRGSRDYLSAPVFTKLQLSRAPGRAHGFREAKVEHRDGVRFKGLWREHKVSDLVRVSHFPAYYKLKDGLLIMHAKKEIARAAVKRLNKELGTQIQLTPIELDLAAVQKSTRGSAPLRGAWFAGKADSDVSSQAAFGRDLNRAATFRRMSKDGNLRNLSLVYPLGRNRLMVNVSRDGSAFLADSHRLPVCLKLMERLARFRVAPPASSAVGVTGSGAP